MTVALNMAVGKPTANLAAIVSVSGNLESGFHAVLPKP